MLGGVEVYRRPERISPRTARPYAAGTYVIPFTQVFARYAKDLLEKQMYPEVPAAPDAPGRSALRRIRVVARHAVRRQNRIRQNRAWRRTWRSNGSLPRPTFVLTGERIRRRHELPLQRRRKRRHRKSSIKGRRESEHRQTARRRAVPQPRQRKPEIWTRAIEGFDVTSKPSPPHAADLGTLPTPRGSACISPTTANMDEGWTRWILDRYEFPYTTLHNQTSRPASCATRFDAIILPDSASATSSTARISRPPSPNTRAACETGVRRAEGFRRPRRHADRPGRGLQSAGRQNAPAGQGNQAHSDREQHYAPGTIVNLQVDTTHPIGLAPAADTFGFYINSPFFQLTEGFSSQKVSVVARYPNSGANASGWLRGEEFMLGRAAVVAVETNPGKLVLFGIRPQHRAQTHATLPLLFNALYWSAEGDLTAGVRAVGQPVSPAICAE